jgi:UDP-N-acetylmuramoyl-tripeptide--D-alanyl-D-alanine ligase
LNASVSDLNSCLHFLCRIPDFDKIWQKTIPVFSQDSGQRPGQFAAALALRHGKIESWQSFLPPIFHAYLSLVSFNYDDCSMVCSVSLAQVIHQLQADWTEATHSDLTITGVTTDTRNLQPGNLFVALQGENFDGHQFVPQAIQQGAIAAVVDRSHAFPNLPILTVDNTLQAYQALGRWWRQQFTIPVIAVTGSVGKTTTKECIAAVLGTQGKVLKSKANHNNEIGVPQTLLRLTADHDYAVIEMGMRGRGEIALLSQIARPDIAVITNVGTAHIGRLGSEQAIAEAKCELLAEMSPEGIAILNNDNERLMQTAAHIWSGETLTYGLKGGDVQGRLLDATTLQVDDRHFTLPLPGEHNALNYLAALTVAKVLNIDWEALQTGVQVDLPSGRARCCTLANDIMILDETYNAGVESMQAALRLLAQTPGNRRLAVLGTMKELGDHSAALHHQVGETVRELALDALLILADEAEAAALAAGANPLPSHRFHSHEQLAAYLQQNLQPGDRILFKASRAVELDKVVNQLLSANQT